MLSAMRAQVFHSTSAGQAIDKARGKPFCCVITPLQLPDMSAVSLIEALGTAAPGLKVIVVVDAPAVKEAVSVMRAGAHAVVDSRLLSTGLFHNVAPLLPHH